MPIPKYVGDDCEFSTTGRGPDGQQIAGGEVTCALLDRIGEAFLPYGLKVWTDRPQGNQPRRDEYRRGGESRWGWDNSAAGATCINRFDSNRNWLPNGGCAYCDCEKLEMATGATLHARRYASQHIASLLIAERARKAVEAGTAPSIELQITAENVDPQDPSASWGTHFNVCIAKSLWEDLHADVRHPNVYSFVTSALAAATVMFGSGYLLPLQNGEVLYSLSARAPHLTRLDSLATTVAFQRGILNSRREGFSSEERQHLINFDFSPASARLRSCLVQLIFSAAEEGYCGLNLFDPVKALRTWSFSLDLQSGRLPEPALLADGARMTLPHYMRALCTVLLTMVESGLIGEDVVPEAADLLPIIIELTHQLDAGALAQCSKHLDWCVKILFLLNLCVDGRARFGDATTRLASFDYTNTNPQRGWFWKLWEAGHVDPLVTKEDVEQALATAPPESRAWGRAGIVRRFHRQVAAVSWDQVTLLRNAAASRWSPRLKIGLPELDSLNQAEFEPILSQAGDVDHLERLLRQRTRVTESEPAMEINTQLLLPDEA
jgi:Pup amidohydrolase